MNAISLGRTVITGHAGNCSAVVSDSHVSAVPLAGDQVLGHFLWGRDGTATFPDDGVAAASESPLPPPGGCRVSYLTIAAGANQSYHDFVGAALGEYADGQHPGFHRTPTLDLVIVLRGAVRLELDRDTVTLGPGELVVQNGTRHRWSNIGDDDAVLASVMLGVHQTESQPDGA